jgi:hypothetical protein
MMDWLYPLPIIWMTAIVVIGIAVVCVLIYVVVFALTVRGWTPAFKGMSPVLLTPLAVVFGLIVGFLCAQVWQDSERASGAVIREAGALRGVTLFAQGFPAPTEARINDLVRRHIRDAVDKEWPAMARHQSALPPMSEADIEAVDFILSLKPENEAQSTAQREMVASLRNAFDARRERLVISRAKINWVKWTVVLVLGTLILVTIALVHSDNRATAVIAMGIFGTAMAACVVLIASHNEPFTGEISVSPSLLLQVLPKE